MMTESENTYEALKSRLDQKIAVLRDVFARAATGDFSKNVTSQETEVEDEFTEINVGVQTMLDVIRDQLSELKKTNASLETNVSDRTNELDRRSRILSSVNYAAARFLRHGDWSQYLDRVLAHLGKSTDVSRVYVFQVIEKNGDYVARQLNEWVGEGVAPQIDNKDLQHFSMREAGFSHWIDYLSNGKHYSQTAASFTNEERAILGAQDIRSILILPVFVRGAWWGFIGFDETRSERTWSDLEKNALGSAAEMLGAAIERAEVEQELQQRASELERLNNILVGRELRMVELKKELQKRKPKP